MTNPFLSEVDGWTPIIEVVAQEVGLIPAAVYGVVWRYCQGEKRVCYASLETMAEKLGINAATVQRHIKALCDAGYVEDLTPGLRNKPHTYRDTGRVEILMLVQARIADSNVEEAQDCRPQPDVADSNVHDVPHCRVQRHIAECNVTLQSATSHCREYVEDRSKRESRDNQGEKVGRASAPARKRTVDARSKHPAVLLVKGVTGRNPPKALYDKVIAIAGDTPDGERAAECYRAWCERGYNPNALTWLTEWYTTGIPGRNGNGKGSPAGGLADFDAMIAQFTEGGSNGEH